MQAEDLERESGERPRLGTEVFWIQGNESMQDTDNLDLDVDLFCVYGTHNY